MNETDLMNEIRLRLTELGATVFRTNVGRVKTDTGRWFDTGLPRGFSDLMALRKGRTYFIEVKVRPNKPTEEQLRFIRRMEEQGFTAGVCYSVADAETLLKEQE